MYGVLGENDSDAKTLLVLIRRLAGNNDSLPVKTKGFRGKSNLLKEGGRCLRLFDESRCRRFVICADADGPDPTAVRREVLSRLVHPAGFSDRACIVVPVQELEAWILADLPSVQKVISGWSPSGVDNPEKVTSPKEFLIRESRDAKRLSRYIPVIHNVQMAKILNLDVVE